MNQKMGTKCLRLGSGLYIHRATCLPHYNGLIASSTSHVEIRLVDVLEYVHWQLLSAVSGLVLCQVLLAGLLDVGTRVLVRIDDYK